MRSIEQAAASVGISDGLLILWIATGRFKPSVELSLRSIDVTDSRTRRALEAYAGAGEEAFGWSRFQFTDNDVERLRGMVEQTAAKKTKTESAHVKGTHYSAQELAALWGFSTDTIRRHFENEPDVLVLGDKSPRGKRRRVTLRIPESVAQRVQKRLSIC